MSDRKIDLQEVLDLLDTWITQQTSVTKFEVSYRAESSAFVTLVVERVGQRQSKEQP